MSTDKLQRVGEMTAITHVSPPNAGGRVKRRGVRVGRSDRISEEIKIVNGIEPGTRRGARGTRRGDSRGLRARSPASRLVAISRVLGATRDARAAKLRTGRLPNNVSVFDKLNRRSWKKRI
ncbi:hypothetical protein ACJJTC_018397 [Scirpophaga incertulas]